MATQEIAEESKNKLLGQVEASTQELEQVLADSIYNSAIAVTVSLVVLIFIIVLVSLVLFVKMGIISTEKAVIAFVIMIIYIVVLSVIFVNYAYEYTRRRVKAAGEVFTNYVASQEAINDIYGAAVVYRTVAGF